MRQDWIPCKEGDPKQLSHETTVVTPKLQWGPWDPGNFRTMEYQQKEATGTELGQSRRALYAAVGRPGRIAPIKTVEAKMISPTAPNA